MQLPKHTHSRAGKDYTPPPTCQPPSLIFCFFIEVSYFRVHHQSFRNVLQRIQYRICSEKCLSQTDTSGKQTANSVISLNKYQFEWNVGCVPRSCLTDLSRHMYYLDNFLSSHDFSYPNIWWPSNLSPLVQATCLRARSHTPLESSAWLIRRYLKPQTGLSHFSTASCSHVKPTLLLPVAPVSVNGTSTPSPINSHCSPPPRPANLPLILLLISFLSDHMATVPAWTWIFFKEAS